MSGISRKPLLQEKGFCHSTPLPKCIPAFQLQSEQEFKGKSLSWCLPSHRPAPHKERRQAGGRAQVCALPASNSEHLIVRKAPGLVECGDLGAGEPGGRGDNTCSVRRHAQERERWPPSLWSPTPPAWSCPNSNS